MPAENYVVIAAIVLAFTLFGGVLAATDFYTRGARPRPGAETE